MSEPSETINEAKQRQVLIAVLAGMFATTFPITILSVSLGVLAEEFNTSEKNISLVVAAPMLFSAVFLPILGKMGDLFGHRKIFLLGFGLATFSSILVSLSWSAESLIGFRAFTAVVGSATQPTAMALLCVAYQGQERVKALGYWSMTTAAAPALGLVIGGPIIDLIGWRLIFVIQAFFSIFAWTYGFFVLRETEKQNAELDVSGSIVFALATSALMISLMLIPDFGISSPWIMSGFLAAFLLLVGFVQLEKRVEHPIIPLRFFKERNFSFAIIANAFSGAGYMGALILTPMFMMRELKYSVSLISGIILMRTISLTIASPFGGQLGAKYGERFTAMLGCFVMTIGIGLLCVGIYAVNEVVIVVGLLLQGVGLGISMPPISASINNSVPNEFLGIASASNRLSNAVGASFGISISAVIMATTTTYAFPYAFASTAIFSFIAFIACFFLNKKIQTN